MEFEKRDSLSTPMNTDQDSTSQIIGDTLAPPPFSLTTDEDEKKEEKKEKKQEEGKEENFLCGAIGAGAPNNPDDLKKLGAYLTRAGVSPFLVKMLVDPAQNGQLIDRYQKEILGWKSTDGVADPGGKTIQAMLNLQGKDIVASWFEPNKNDETQSEKTGKKPEKEIPAPKSDDKASKPVKLPSSGKKDIEPILSSSQYFSAFTQCPQHVPLTYLKANMNAKSNETNYRNAGCYHTCRYTLEQGGFSPQGKESTKYMVEVATNGKEGAEWRKSISGVSAEAPAGKSRLDSLLEAKMPVIIGVNRDDQNFRATNYKPDGSVSPSDHYVIVVGRVSLEGGKTGYRYYDPGRYGVANGTSSTNLLIQENDYLKGEGYQDFTYTLGEIRDTKKP